MKFERTIRLGFNGIHMCGHRRVYGATYESVVLFISPDWQGTEEQRSSGALGSPALSVFFLNDQNRLVVILQVQGHVTHGLEDAGRATKGPRRAAAQANCVIAADSPSWKIALLGNQAEVLWAVKQTNLPSLHENALPASEHCAIGFTRRFRWDLDSAWVLVDEH